MAIITDIIVGVFQSILTDAIKKEGKKSHEKYKGCLGCLIIIVGILGISFVVLILWILFTVDTTPKNIGKESWTEISVGDSLFVKPTFLGLNFYKKGRSKLYDWEQRAIRYAREDTLDFIRVNNVPEKFFFKKKTSFIGICIGLDSTATKSGSKWIMVKPSYEITHPTKSEGTYNYGMREWKSPQHSYEGFKLSKNFYVQSSDILLTNNDVLFK